MISIESKLELYIKNQQEMTSDVQKMKSDCASSSYYLNDHLKTLFQCCGLEKTSGYKNLDHLDAYSLQIMANYKLQDKCLLVEAALNGHFEMIQWLVQKG